MNVTREAGSLVATLMFKPWGQVSASVYETGRLVTLAPWLTGHRERVDYLLRTQRPDGSWGAPDGYGLVPALSATEALLTVAAGDLPADVVERAAEAARRGLAALHLCLPRVADLPDMPAVDLIVPALVTLINAHGAAAPLPLPSGLDYSRVERVRHALETGADLPEKLLHALEVTGLAAGGARSVRPTVIGTIGASPAATAAWLANGATLEADFARSHLEAVVSRYGGPVPVGLPITVFERGWVLTWLARAGIPVEVPPEMVADLRAAIGPGGTPAGPGLPADADTTAVALHALALHGMARDPESLLAFDTGTHFCTWQGEDGFSISVNAHVLDAFGSYAATGPARAGAYRQIRTRLADLLAERQQPGGSWEDRWHASPYYATLSCVLALGEHGGPEHAGAVARAREWVLDTQRADGSWGRWEGTLEETAYAMQTLLLPERARGRTVGERYERAAARGHESLQHTGEMSDYPSLWHDKDLYTPIAIVRAAILAALHLGTRVIESR
ncbi:Prenyltransferase and squalene oxidase repeat-containing protein [Nonomuraea solani]|uniref:Prenyltransferase and squalene oxidase repeat-containing protein n=1 Tax=Nonomuraea solani TaxID=1144553 RepID=A0A1H5YLP9_9ACTN|nr:prenyltransferase/squalene oxidase repeat-containing protein [Nonomuraea solani]SEG24427.1 Prenyltransferase and squalene oxidase repeat-containing protein [Nonomuraea solani]